MESYLGPGSVGLVLSSGVYIVGLAWMCKNMLIELRRVCCRLSGLPLVSACLVPMHPQLSSDSMFSLPGSLSARPKAIPALMPPSTFAHSRSPAPPTPHQPAPPPISPCNTVRNQTPPPLLPTSGNFPVFLYSRIASLCLPRIAPTVRKMLVNETVVRSVKLRRLFWRQCCVLWWRGGVPHLNMRAMLAVRCLHEVVGGA